ncbi:MAG: GDP-mannose 4,6-dehydratase [Actinomycetota bacterium]|nr:GDP-mannose 4,6-dehydratase [Actinomycetota bacterium]
MNASVSGRTALVTGAGGFIASHLIERLVLDGAKVRALCRYTSRREIGELADVDPGVLAEADLRFGDLGDADLVRDAAAGVDLVFHLGASISVPYSYVAPREVVTTNVLGTLNVLQAARAAGCARVVQMSSSEVYGSALRVPMDEDHPLNAQSPYAASKVGADKLAESFHLSYELPVVVARPFNTYGPRQSPRAVIGTIIDQALTGEGLELGALDTSRDFVFVADTIEALIRLATSDAVVGRVLNIATGVDVTVREIVDLVGEIVGRPLAVTTHDARLRPKASEVRQLCGDATRLREATGWAPATTLRDGLERVVAWRRERGATPRPGEYAV